MLAELMVRAGQRLVKRYPPEGREYWSATPWDRTPFEKARKVGADLALKREIIGGYLSDYGKDAKRVLELCCGTGKFTKIAAERCSAPELVAVDISTGNLKQTEANVRDPRMKTVQGDFWDDDLGVGTADLVMCINAIHHLGDVEQVLERLLTFVEPGGILIGNVLTMDHFHEFQRDVHGTAGHVTRSARFLANGITMALTGGRVRGPSYRSQLLKAEEIELLLRRLGLEVLRISTTRYIVNFVIRR